MAIAKAKINPAGGPVSASVSFGYAQLGLYTIVLWSRDLSTSVPVGKGGSADSLPDTFPLPGHPADLVGCLLDCLASVMDPNPAPGNQYSVNLTVSQDGADIGSESDRGAIGSQMVFTRLVIQLV